MTPIETQNLLPHQQRVVEEQKELDARLAKLRLFMKTSTFESLSSKEQGLQQRQAICMEALSLVLGDRIAHFMKDKP